MFKNLPSESLITRSSYTQLLAEARSPGMCPAHRSCASCGVARDAPEVSGVEPWNLDCLTAGRDFWV